MRREKRVKPAEPTPEPPAKTAVEYAVRQTRKIVIFVIGITVFILGILMLPLPGPGAPIILGGLAILAVEFWWARRMLTRARDAAEIPKRVIFSPRRIKLIRKLWWRIVVATTRGRKVPPPLEP